jgi:hypothetical protein
MKGRLQDICICHHPLKDHSRNEDGKLPCNWWFHRDGKVCKDFQLSGELT